MIVAGSSFEAGTDNTASGILWFLVAAMHSPAVVNRAREEIDQLLGAEGDVVPAFRHLAQLPYCLALVKEVLRCDTMLISLRSSSLIPS